MDRKIATIRSLSKVMWIQNDLFSRHYTVRTHDVKAVKNALQERDETQSESLEISSTSGTGSNLSGHTSPSTQYPKINEAIGFGIAEPKPKRSFLNRLGL